MRKVVRQYLGFASPDMDDVLQDVFLQAWLHCETLREDSCCAGWLMRITANTCVSYLRRAKRDVPCDVLVPDEPDDGYARLMTRLMMEDALAHLSPSAKQVVWLHDLEGYPMREVARRMHRPENTVKSVLHRARLTMRSAQSEPGWACV